MDMRILRAGPNSLDSPWTKISASSIMSNTLWREAMRRKRRTHSPEFKAKVALAAIQRDLTMAEMVKKFDVHANQITERKKQLLKASVTRKKRRKKKVKKRRQRRRQKQKISSMRIIY